MENKSRSNINVRGTLNIDFNNVFKKQFRVYQELVKIDKYYECIHYGKIKVNANPQYHYLYLHVEMDERNKDHSLHC